MDFIVSLPKTRSDKDSIWMILDRLTKSIHFLPIKISCTLDMLDNLYVNKIGSRYDVPVSIVSNKDPRFASHF